MGYLRHVEYMDGSQSLICGPVEVPPHVEAHKANFPPAELECIQFECDVLPCTCLRELLRVPERVLHTGVIEERVVNTLQFPCDPCDGVVVPPYVCIQSCTVTHGCSQMLVTAPGGNKGGDHPSWFF